MNKVFNNTRKVRSVRRRLERNGMYDTMLAYSRLSWLLIRKRINMC